MNRAGRNHHGVDRKRATGERTGDIFHAPGEMRPGFQVRRFFSGLQIKSFFAGAAQDQMDFSAGPAQPFQQTEGVNRPACTGYADDYPQKASRVEIFLFSGLTLVPNSEQWYTILLKREQVGAEIPPG